jgi:hypothetical protein
MPVIPSQAVLLLQPPAVFLSFLVSPSYLLARAADFWLPTSGENICKVLHALQEINVGFINPLVMRPGGGCTGRNVY